MCVNYLLVCFPAKLYTAAAAAAVDVEWFGDLRKSFFVTFFCIHHWMCRFACRFVYYVLFRCFVLLLLSLFSTEMHNFFLLLLNRSQRLYRHFTNVCTRQQHTRRPFGTNLLTVRSNLMRTAQLKPNRKTKKLFLVVFFSRFALNTDKSVYWTVNARTPREQFRCRRNRWNEF